MAHSAALEQRAERITSHGWHPSIATAGNNNYNATARFSHYYGGVPDWTPSDWLATFGEFNWAVSEAVSFGYSKYLRERVYGEYTSGAAHYAGMGAGIGISLLLGYGAAKTAGWTAKALGAYVIAGDVIGVTESSYHLAKGDFQPLHALGFVPMVGWGLGSARRFGGFTKEILIDASAGYHAAPSFVPVVIPVMPMLPMVHPAITAASVGLVVGDQVYTAWRYGRTARQLADRADELLHEYIRHRYADFKQAGSLRELDSTCTKGNFEFESEIKYR